MTKEEIAALEPGPKMDALVAQELMGIKLSPEYGPGMYLSKPPGSVVAFACNVPPYSTQLPAAWLVIERMKEMGYRFGARNSIRGDIIGWIFRDPADYIKGHGSSNSAPEAICKAALEVITCESRSIS